MAFVLALKRPLLKGPVVPRPTEEARAAAAAARHIALVAIGEEFPLAGLTYAALMFPLISEAPTTFPPPVVA